jgi:glutaminase
MLTKTGVEPSGDAFNAISLHRATGRPFNPMINAGAIATTGQVRADSSQQRVTRILQMFGRYTGHPMRIDPAVYDSENRTGHRNRAIGHLLRNFEILDDDPTATVDAYFQQCSIPVHCADLALMGATLANQGVNPVTGVRAVEDAHVENVLSVMASCGMYDFSGGWIYNVGMPAKSGVSGGVLAVLPGQFGIGVFSPRIDEQGNSVRALKVCQEVSRAWELHQFNPPYCPRSSRRLSYSCAERNSSRIRHPRELACVRDNGSRVRVFEIQGNLAFATTESIIRDVISGSGEQRSVILDFHHVTAVNGAAARLLADLATAMVQRGTATFFTHTQGLPSLRQQVAAHWTDAVAVDRLFRFSTTDLALEWCEDDLLRTTAIPVPSRVDDLRAFEIAAGLNEQELELLDVLLTRQRYSLGDFIIRRDAEATNLFLIMSGVVGVWLGEPGTGSRAASFSVGTMVGELAFLDGARRSAHVVAESDVECSLFDVADFLRLQESHPRTHATILRNLAVSLATKLRKANNDVSILSAQRS